MYRFTSTLRRQLRKGDAVVVKLHHREMQLRRNGSQPERNGTKRNGKREREKRNGKRKEKKQAQMSVSINVCLRIYEHQALVRVLKQQNETK